jgi:Flp pilus assembly pilin Flp
MWIFRTTKAMDETGQTMAEYAVVLALIIVVTLAAFTSLGGGVENALNSVQNVLP